MCHHNLIIFIIHIFSLCQTPTKTKNTIWSIIFLTFSHCDINNGLSRMYSIITNYPALTCHINTSFHVIANSSQPTMSIFSPIFLCPVIWVLVEVGSPRSKSNGFDDDQEYMSNLWEHNEMKSLTSGMILTIEFQIMRL